MKKIKKKFMILLYIMYVKVKDYFLIYIINCFKENGINKRRLVEYIKKYGFLVFGY